MIKMLSIQFVSTYMMEGRQPIYFNIISQTVGAAILAMFLVTCFFMPHPMIILLVTLSMVSILLGVFGFLKFWGLDISVVTMIELVISVGFSVDFSAHICH
jgi:multidrug efflux pump subunit AcrB